MVAFSCSSRAVSASIPFCRSTIARCWRLSSRRFLSRAWTEMFPRADSCFARFRSRASTDRISRSRFRASVSASRLASRSTIRALVSASRASLSFSAERYSNSSMARIVSPRRISPPSTRLGWISTICPVTRARIWIWRAANIFPNNRICGRMSFRAHRHGIHRPHPFRRGRGFDARLRADQIRRPDRARAQQHDRKQDQEHLSHAPLLFAPAGGKTLAKLRTGHNGGTLPNRPPVPGFEGIPGPDAEAGFSTLTRYSSRFPSPRPREAGLGRRVDQYDLGKPSARSAM